MSFGDLIREAISGLMQQKLRSLLTLSGVVLGSMLLFCSISGGIGVLDAIYERLSVGGRLLRIEVGEGWRSTHRATPQDVYDRIPVEVTGERRERLAASLAAKAGMTTERIPLKFSQLEEFRRLSGVRAAHVDARLNAAVQLAGTDELWGSVGTYDADFGLFQSLLIEGRLPRDNSSREVVVYEDALVERGYYTDAAISSLIDTELRLVRTRLTPEELEARTGLHTKQQALTNMRDVLTGEQLKKLEAEIKRLRETPPKVIRSEPSWPFRIVGVLRRPTSDDAAIRFWSLRYNPVLIPIDTATEYEASYRDGDRDVEIDVVVESLEHLKPTVDAIEARGFRTSSLATLAQRIRSAVLLVSAIITAIAATAFFIAALGMTNTMVMNVLERRREIGILKSIGARDRDVLWMFLMEGTLVGLMGGLLGLGLGVAGTGLCGDYVRGYLEAQLKESFTNALFAYPWWLITGTPALAALVTMVATWIPARRAARLDPVSTLRAL